MDAILDMPECDRFLRGMITWVGFRQIPIHYNRASRFAGKTKYPFKKMVKLAMDGIFSFSPFPLRITIYLGLAVTGLATIGAVHVLIIRWLTSEWLNGWTLLFIAVLFLGGVQLLVLGVIGEYIGRIYRETNNALYIWFANDMDSHVIQNKMISLLNSRREYRLGP